jgi:DMSO/TMAO reductase YedYZ heme-binding membrane subunit
MIAFVTPTALQCLPVRYAWERWDGEHHGRCINLNADAWASAAINIVLDLIVIVLPLRELKNLAMSRRRKLGVIVMFLGGGL